jgi:hypothetical protein
MLHCDFSHPGLMAGVFFFNGFQGLALESRWTRRNLDPYNRNTFANDRSLWEGWSGNA